MIKINLLPVPVRRKLEFLIFQGAVAAGAVAATVVVCFVIGQGYDRQIAAIKTDIIDVKRQIEQEKAKVGNIQLLEKQQSELQNQINVIKQLETGRSGPVRMLDELATLIPDRVWIKSLTEQNKKIQIQAESLSKSAISDFVERLGKSKFFTGIILDKVTSQTKEGREINQFDLTGTINYTAL